MKQTAVEWLIEQLIFKQEYEHLPNNYFLMSDKDIDKIIEQAKEMEKQQIIDAYEEQNIKWDEFIDEDGRLNLTNKYRNPIEYYDDTYGSKGSDEIEKSEKPINLTSFQTEISDEEIERKAASYFDKHCDDWAYDGFKDGATWYREQLKSRQ